MPVDLDPQQKVALIRLVYIGGASSGRGTNLRALWEAAREERRGPLVVSEEGPEQTLSFEFAPLAPVHLRGREIRFQVMAVSGATPRAAVRQRALAGAHGVVFVADSSRARLQETMVSFREMARQIANRPRGAFPVPVVFQYNKRDVADALSEAEMEEALNPRKLHAVIPAVAIRGEGVLETLGGIMLATTGILVEQNVDLDLLSGRNVESWARGDVEGLFGRLSLSAPVPGPVTEPAATTAEASAPSDTWTEPTGPTPAAVESEPTSPGRLLYDMATEAVTRRLSVVLVERALAALAAANAAAGDAEPLEVIEEELLSPPPPPPQPEPPSESPAAPPHPEPAPHAEVVATPAAPSRAPAPADDAPPRPAAEARPKHASRDADVARLRRQRDAALAESDEARFRLEDLRLAVSVGTAMSRGDRTTSLMLALLARLVRRFGAGSASLLAPSDGGTVRVVAGLDAEGDPLAMAPRAGQLVAGLVARQNGPVLREPADRQELAQALEGAGYTPAPIVVAPLRTPRGLHGVIVLYLEADAPPPEESALALLASAADALALGVGRAAEA